MAGLRLARKPRAPAPSAPSAKRTARGWAVAGCLIGALPALTVFAPAHWLAQRVDIATQAKVQLLQPRGTVWNGSAQLLFTGGSGSHDRAALPGAVHWQIRPTLSGLKLQLRADCCTLGEPLSAQLAIGWSGATLTLNDSQSQWPAALLSGLGTPWNTLQPQGQLALQTQSLQMHWAAGRMRLQGQAHLDARSMSTRLSTLRPMGSYRLELLGGEVPKLTLITLDGHLQLTGSGQWVGQRLRFQGEAQAAPGREAALSNLLNIIGRRNGARSIITVG